MIRNEIPSKAILDYIKKKNTNPSGRFTLFDSVDVETSALQIEFAEACTEGFAVHISTDGKGYVASRNGKPAHAFCYNDVASNSFGKIVIAETIIIPDATFTVGSKVYLDLYTAPNLNITTDAPPVVEGYLFQELGLAIAADQMLINLKTPRIIVA